MVIELMYSGTNTYLVQKTDGSVLFDMGWRERSSISGTEKP